MPCYDQENDAGAQRAIAEDARKELRRRAHDLHAEHQRNLERYGVDATDEGVARAVACELGKLVVEELGEVLRMSPLAKAWVGRHMEEDAKREG